MAQDETKTPRIERGLQTSELLYAGLAGAGILELARDPAPSLAAALLRGAGILGLTAIACFVTVCRTRRKSHREEVQYENRSWRSSTGGVVETKP